MDSKDIIETQVQKTIIKKDIPIDYADLSKAKKFVYTYIENNIKYHYDDENEVVVLKVFKTFLTRKDYSIVDENTYLVASVRLLALVFKPTLKSYCHAKIIEITKTHIKLSFFDIIKGLILIVKDVEENNENIQNSIINDKANKKSLSENLLEYNYEESSFKELSDACLSTLKNSKTSVKFEVGKFIKVFIKERVVRNSGEFVIVCGININNVV